MWKLITQQRSRFGRTNIFHWSCIFGLHSKTMWKKQRYCGQLQNHVWIANFSRRNRKASTLWESSYLFMVLWYGRSCKEVCGAILWVGKQDHSTTLHSVNSMHLWPPLQRRRNKICWSIVKYMLSNCSECLYLARNNDLNRLISYVHHTCEYKTVLVMWEIPLNNEVWDCFKILTPAGDLEDILWSVNKLARSISLDKMDPLWKACDKRLNRLISYIHHTCEYKQYCFCG